MLFHAKTTVSVRVSQERCRSSLFWRMSLDIDRLIAFIFIICNERRIAHIRTCGQRRDNSFMYPAIVKNTNKGVQQYERTGVAWSYVGIQGF